MIILKKQVEIECKKANIHIEKKTLHMRDSLTIILDINLITFLFGQKILSIVSSIAPTPFTTYLQNIRVDLFLDESILDFKVQSWIGKFILKYIKVDISTYQIG